MKQDIGSGGGHYQDHHSAYDEPAPKRRAMGAAFGTNDHIDIYRNMLDCCVIYVDKQLRTYAESVQSVCVSAGLSADVQFISRDESLAGTLDSLSQKGIISAVILDELNEQRKTANVHFLHGTPRGEVQTGIAELPHWLRMQEEYNKYLIATGKRGQSLREMLAELCGESGRSATPSGMNSAMMNGSSSASMGGPSGSLPPHGRGSMAGPPSNMPHSNETTRTFIR